MRTTVVIVTELNWCDGTEGIVYMCTGLSVCLCVCVSVCLCVYVSVCLCVCVSVYSTTLMRQNST